MDFSPTITRKSEAAEGVSYVVRRLSFLKRAERDATIAEYQHRMDDLSVEIRNATPSTKTLDEAEEVIQSSPELRRALEERERLMITHVIPAVIRAGLVSIEGLTVEGKPMTVEQFLDLADRDLISEAYSWCEAASKMTSEALKNLQSLGIFGTPAGGPGETTNAPNAAGTNSIETGTVADTTPVM